MNSCFEEFVDFKGIISDEPYRISNYSYTGVTSSLLIGTNKSMENVVRLILEEIIISDRHMLDVQFYSFMQLFFNNEEICLN